MRTTTFRSRGLLALAGAIFFLAVAATVFAVHDDNLFELGEPPYNAGSANIAGDGNPATGPDWGDLFTSTGSLKDVIAVAGRPDYKDYGGIGADFVKDDIATGSSTDNTVFDLGKMNDQVSAWTWKVGNVPKKDDIRNIYLYATVDPVPDPIDGKNHLRLYAGIERINANGDAHLSIELNQDTILPKNDHTFSGARTAGDLALSMDFSAGGGFGTLSIYRWNGAGFDIVQNLGAEGCNAGDTVCAFNNGVAITGILGDSIDPNGFTEIGMDLTKLVPGGQLPCFGGIMFKTRSAVSLGSDLKDFSISSLKLCGLEVTKNCSDTLSGQPINFTGSIENVGVVPLKNISITDDQPGSSIAPLAATVLQPGQSVAYTGSYTPSASSGNATDTVTATGHAYDSTGQSVTDTAEATCKIDVASISVTKQCTAGKPGDPILFSGTITNTGTILLNDISITDDQPGSVITPASISSLVAGASVGYSGSYIPDLIPGSKADMVHVIGHKADSSTVEAFGSATCTVTGPPTISKAFAATTIPQFGTTTLSFTITNTNAVSLAGIGFSDALPAGLVIDNPVVLSGSCGGGSISTGTDSISLSGATLGPLGSCTFSVKVAGTTLGVKNNLTGKVTSTAGGDGNQAFATLSVEEGKVIIHKTSDATPSTTLGNTITYSFQITNTGTSTISSFTVTDTKLGAITCPVSSLAPGASTTCTATHVVLQSDMNAGSIYNKVTVNGVTPVGPVSASDDLTVTLIQHPKLTLHKSAAETIYSAVGNVLHYSYLVKNEGDVSFAGPVTVADDKSSDETCPAVTTVGNGDGFLDPGEAITCTATYTITQADLNAGSVTNVASASAGSTTSLTDTVTVNAQAPKLTLVKTVINDNGGTKQVADFPLFVNGSPVTSGVANTLSANVLYTATETSDPGYTASPWGGDCAANGTITLVWGDNKTCTIKNDDKGTKLTLIKTVINDNGGTKQIADFPLFVNGSPVTSGVATTLSASVLYTATETSDPGYTASAWGGDCAADGTITMALGDNKTCTISNDDKAPKLTLVKTVINDNGGTKQVSDFPLFVNGSPVTSGIADTLSANVLYTATETSDPGYTASAWGGDCAANGTITLALGDNKTCTITNDDKAATLTLVKTVVNNDGGTKTPSDFSLFVNGSPVTTGVAVTLSANLLYTATETSNPGYTASAWGGDCAADGTITLTPGDNKTCTITNDDKAPKLTLVKTVINNNGGTKQVSDFPLFVNGSPVTSGGVTTLSANVLYTATETSDPGYAASAWGGDCAPNGTITLAPGDNKTCTITNDDKATTLTLIKTVINDNGGTKQVSNFPLFVNGSPVTSGGATTLSANVLYTATETSDPGYTASAWGGDCAPNGTITLALGDNKTCTITNDDKAPKLILVKTVINDNGGTKTPSDFSLFVNGSPVTTGVAVTLSANVLYIATEAPSPGYTASVWGGDCAANGTITLAPGDNKTCTITNDDNATIPIPPPTGQITPTGTTCQQFRDGTAVTLSTIEYHLKGANINNVAPGVFFYYVGITAPSSNFAIKAGQSNSSGWPVIASQKDQVIVYANDCVRVPNTTVNFDANGDASINVNAATPGATYYVSIKYDPRSVVGFTPNGTPTVPYVFGTYNYPGSAAIINFISK